MKIKTISLATLVAFSAVLPGALPSMAQVTATSLQVTIHEDMLKCYEQLGRPADQEREFQWLIAARPSKALWHYNYGCLLRSENKNGLAFAQFERAAQLEGSNVDYEGQAGQMAYNMKNFQKAYNYLGKAIQLPGGEKYKGAFDACQAYLQNIAQQAANNRVAKPKASGGATTGKPKTDDDDD